MDIFGDYSESPVLTRLGVRFIPTGGRFKGMWRERFDMREAEGGTSTDVIPLCNKRFIPTNVSCFARRIVNALGDYIICWLSRWENWQKSNSKDHDLDLIRSPWKIVISISISMIVTALDVILPNIRGLFSHERSSISATIILHLHPTSNHCKRSKGIHDFIHDFKYTLYYYFSILFNASEVYY